MKAPIILLVISLFFACNEQKANNPEELFKNTSVVELTDENISLKLPNSFKRTSRYKLGMDIPSLREDSSIIERLGSSLRMMEFDDSSIDVFYDTEEEFRILIFTNTMLLPFNIQDASFLKGMFQKNFDRIERKNPGLTSERLVSTMKKNSRQQMMKFKYKMSWEEELSLYQSFYFVTTKLQTIGVIELSLNDKEIDNYLWSIKD